MTSVAKKPKKAESSQKPAEKSASEAIKEIEPVADSRVIVYTSGRNIGYWDIPPLYRLLDKLGHQQRLSVILQSHGGFTDDAFKMANTIHEFADDVVFIVPSYANSAATLLCLSGNKVLMGPTSELSPTNPMMNVDERLITPTILELKPVSTEPKEKDMPKQRQMAAYALRDFLIASGVLIKGESGRMEYDPQKLSVYMANGILNPFLLGEFERSGKKVIQYAEALLSRYMFCKRKDCNELAHKTAEDLCEGYYDHNYPIGRKEARDVLKLEVEDMPDELWRRSSELLTAYDRMMGTQNIATLIETSEAFEIDHWQQSSG
jgi:hypothetical protein